MRAWQIHQHGEPQEALRLGEAECPEPGAGWLKLRVLAAGVGLPDLLMCRGSYVFAPQMPFTPGQEVVGEVIGVGEGARARLGQRVMAVAGFHIRSGSFAEECIALDDFAPTVPDAMSNEEAAGFVIPYWTAYFCLVERAALVRGETLLVLGAAGGTGTAAIQLGKALGARVIAVAGGAEKTALCRELGADVVIDHREQDIANAVNEATDQQGANVVYDPVGGEAYASAARATARGGRILAVGFASGSWGQPVIPHMVANNYSVLGAMPAGAERSFVLRAEEELCDHWKAGRLKTQVHRVFPFEEVPAAIDELARREARGKVVINVA